MSGDASEPKERLPLLDPQGLTKEQRELYERLEESLLPWARESGFEATTEKGKLLGPFNALLYNPEMGAAQLNYLKTERDSTELDATVREVVILTVGAACHCAYELYAHRAVAAKTGLAQGAIEALANGAEPEGVTEAERTAHRFVRALVVEHAVPDEVYGEAERVFGHKGLVDMVHLVGLYLATSALLNAFAVPVP